MNSPTYSSLVLALALIPVGANAGALNYFYSFSQPALVVSDKANDPLSAQNVSFMPQLATVTQTQSLGNSSLRSVLMPETGAVIAVTGTASYASMPAFGFSSVVPNFAVTGSENFGSFAVNTMSGMSMVNIGTVNNFASQSMPLVSGLNGGGLDAMYAAMFRPTNPDIGNFTMNSNLTITPTLPVVTPRVFASVLSINAINVPDFELHGAPEPSTWLLIGGGLGLIAILRRRLAH
jgi:hypothetical protein